MVMSGVIFIYLVFSRLYSICCIIMGLGLVRCLGSFPPVHSVCAPNWPRAGIRTCWHSSVCHRFGNTKSEMNFDKKNKTKQLIDSSSSFFFALSTGLDLWTDCPLLKENCCYWKNDSCTFMAALHLYRRRMHHCWEHSVFIATLSTRTLLSFAMKQ